MTSQLNVDTIVDKAGTGGATLSKPTITEMANTSTYTSDGGAVTQNTIQSLGKSWVNWNGTSTVAVQDSLNHSSLTDNGTGDYTSTISSAMSNTSYCRTGMCGMATNSQEAISQAQNDVAATTTAGRYITAYANTNTEDVPYAGVVLHGDLA